MGIHFSKTIMTDWCSAPSRPTINKANAVAESLHNYFESMHFRTLSASCNEPPWMTILFSHKLYYCTIILCRNGL